MTVLTEEDVDISIEYDEHFGRNDIYTVTKIGKNVFNIKNTKVINDAHVNFLYLRIIFTTKSGLSTDCLVHTRVHMNEGRPYLRTTKSMKQIEWTNHNAGDLLATVEADDREEPPYNKLTYVLPRYNNDLWGLVDLNSTSGKLIMRKELEEEKRTIIS